MAAICTIIIIIYYRRKTTNVIHFTAFNHNFIVTFLWYGNKLICANKLQQLTELEKIQNISE